MPPPTSASPSGYFAPDGTSVYTVHGSRTYTSAAILDAERRLLEAAERTDGYVIPEILVDLTVRRDAADGVGLDTGQAELVKALATSGARIQVALAPAGSGKTTAMTTPRQGLAQWRRARHRARARPRSQQTSSARRSTCLPRPSPSSSTAPWPPRATAGLRPSRPSGRALSSSSTRRGWWGPEDLAAVVDRVLERGGSVRLVGDDQQLTAVAASGVFRDLAEQGAALGTTVRLTELHRFSDRRRRPRHSASGAATPRS